MLVGIDDWITFIHNGLRENIVEDSRDMLILNEADLQCSVSRHLRHFHSKEYYDPEWHVHNEFRQKKKGTKQTTFPDVQIFRKDKLRIAMELKHYFGRSLSEDKLIEDIEKLSKRAEDSSNQKSVLLFTCDLAINERKKIAKNLSQKATHLFEGIDHHPELVCINSYEEEELDFEWGEKYRTHIEEWGKYG